ncbi:hypothetical protein E4U46_006035 [Claviceps purpurea]|nr:hypothetical protein E4U46_006035 [Claviceps purpurea]
MSNDGPGPEFELDNHLRGLILTSQPSQTEAVGPSMGARGYSAGARGSSMHWDDYAPSEGPPHAALDSQRGPHPLKSSRRRPNQARRRQIDTEMSVYMASPQNPSHAFQQRALQHNEVVCHRLNIRGGMLSTGDIVGRQLPECRRELNVQSAAPYNSASSPIPILSETHMNAPHHSNRPVPGQLLPPQAAQYLPTTSPQTYGRQSTNPYEIANETALLDKLCHEVIWNTEIELHEIARKEKFRQKVEVICKQVISDHEYQHGVSSNFPKSSVELKCFGSMSSGFATRSSDMDLGLLSPLSGIQPDSPKSPIPRLIEKALLEAGYGARLLSRARVPIIKLCETPSEALRSALLAERTKWENGFDTNATEGYVDQFQELDGHIDVANAVKGVEVLDIDPVCTKFQLPPGQTHGGEEAELKQTPNSSLKAYYCLAKRVLRRSGGRDIIGCKQHEFRSSDWAILNRICRAFVRGLYDDLLRHQLESRFSLSFESRGTGSINRSLAGVFTQVEGERLLLDWQLSPAKDALQGSSGRIDRIIRNWEEVQNKIHYGDDPFTYNKELQSACELLRCQPEFELMQLAQKPKETPTEYYHRTCRLVCKLEESVLHDFCYKEQRLVLMYIMGIDDESIRHTMTLANASGNTSFDELGQKHQCLQLAHVLERAIRHQSYDQSLTGDISEYIQLLRKPLAKVHLSGQAAFRIPVTKQLLPILSRIRLLPDPRTLEINQSRGSCRDPLEFPNSGVGVQCDINFSPHLALLNTRLLRCYSLTDPRVRPIVLFIKRWAKVRGINSGYRGTLSSYGFVLMVLHFLVNVSKPFVCPNLQHLAPSTSETGSGTVNQDHATVRGYNVQFWQNEPEISCLAANCQLTHNTETIGQLIRGFFEYFAQSGPMGHGLGRGFDWGRDVLSLRTHGGLLTKQEKGWTGAKTVIEGRSPTPSLDSAQNGNSTHVKEIRHRYLFAIEDPFELDHNVARTVTHNGIVTIRDEFRRAWRLIRTSSRGWSGDLLSDLTKPIDEPDSFEQLLQEIHGPKELWQRFK